MKVLVLNPPFKGRFSRTSRSPAVTKGGTLYYPFWLSYAVGVLDKEGFEVDFIDAPAERKNLEYVLDRVRSERPRLVVLDTSTPSIYNDVCIAGNIKDIVSDAFTIAVGTHPSALPVETLSLEKKLDAVAIGEYDYTIRDLALALRDSGDLRKVDGIVFREGEDIIFNKSRPRIENLDELPFVSRVYKKYLNIKNYFFAVSNYPFAMIITGRGCPARCFFCVYPQTFHDRKYRMRSAESVVDEFEYIVKELKIVREIGIEDDTFTIDRGRVQKICELLLKRKIHIPWYCNVRVGLDFDTMKSMKRAGCRMITVGFEFPGENMNTLEEMLNFAKEMNTDGAQFYPLIVYPGTEAFEWAKNNGYLTTMDYSKWATEAGGHNCVINLPGLSSKDLVSFCNRATKEYYIRPRYLISKLRNLLLRPKEIKIDIIAGKTFLNHLIFDK
ncbi:MAG: radical SAM protein [Candidatus Omnitrophica bacterium]|nr:radical SAM protein [Candidatus Omnitrophota bacterium]